MFNYVEYNTCSYVMIELQDGECVEWTRKLIMIERVAKEFRQEISDCKLRASEHIIFRLCSKPILVPNIEELLKTGQY